MTLHISFAKIHAIDITRIHAYSLIPSSEQSTWAMDSCLLTITASSMLPHLICVLFVVDETPSINVRNSELSQCLSSSLKNFQARRYWRTSTHPSITTSGMHDPGILGKDFAIPMSTQETYKLRVTTWFKFLIKWLRPRNSYIFHLHWQCGVSGLVHSWLLGLVSVDFEGRNTSFELEILNLDWMVSVTVIRCWMQRRHNVVRWLSCSRHFPKWILIFE